MGKTGNFMTTSPRFIGEYAGEIIRSYQKLVKVHLDDEAFKELCDKKIKEIEHVVKVYNDWLITKHEAMKELFSLDDFTDLQ